MYIDYIHVICLLGMEVKIFKHDYPAIYCQKLRKGGFNCNQVPGLFGTNCLISV